MTSILVRAAWLLPTWADTSNSVPIEINEVYRIEHSPEEQW